MKVIRKRVANNHPFCKGCIAIGDLKLCNKLNMEIGNCDSYDKNGLFRSYIYIEKEKKSV